MYVVELHSRSRVSKHEKRLGCGKHMCIRNILPLRPLELRSLPILAASLHCGMECSLTHHLRRPVRTRDAEHRALSCVCDVAHLPDGAQPRGVDKPAASEHVLPNVHRLDEAQNERRRHRACRGVRYLVAREERALEGEGGFEYSGSGDVNLEGCLSTA